MRDQSTPPPTIGATTTLSQVGTLSPPQETSGRQQSHYKPGNRGKVDVIRRTLKSDAATARHHPGSRDPHKSAGRHITGSPSDRRRHQYGTQKTRAPEARQITNDDAPARRTPAA